MCTRRPGYALAQRSVLRRVARHLRQSFISTPCTNHVCTPECRSPTTTAALLISSTRVATTARRWSVRHPVATHAIRTIDRGDPSLWGEPPRPRTMVNGLGQGPARDYPPFRSLSVLWAKICPFGGFFQASSIACCTRSLDPAILLYATVLYRISHTLHGAPLGPSCPRGDQFGRRLRL